jgi:hypothetical protein
MNAPHFRFRWHERLAGAGRVLRIGKKRYVVNGPSQVALRFLDQFDLYLQRAAGPVSLLPFRHDFRLIEYYEPVVGLMWWAERGAGPCRKIAIWLLGRIPYGCDVSVLARCRFDADFRVRRHAAKALWRMGAWAALRDLAADDPDRVVRRIAEHAARPPTDFATRLSRYLRDEVHAQALASRPRRERPRLYLKATPGVGLPPKSPWFIRMILERIRRLVHGGASQGRT